MRTALIISIIVHILLTSGVYWSTNLSLMMMQSRRKLDAKSGAIQVDLTYKATDTPMRKGKSKRELPPPKVKRKKEPPRPQLVKRAKPKKPKRKPKPKKEEPPKKNFKALFDQIREEEGLDRKKPPREDNFPTREDGVEDAFGTGGRSEQKLTPAQLAFQAAARKHHKVPQAESWRKKYPDAEGFIAVRLIATGSKLQIVSMQMVQSSGVSILDTACKAAIRKAIQEETFAIDIVRELSGRENTITCRF